MALRPALPLLYLRAAASALPLAGRLPFLPGGGGRADGLRVGGRAVVVDPERLAAYRELCGFPPASALPPTYPHLLAFPLQLALLCDGRFPFSPLGLVHLENELEVAGDLPIDSPYDLTLWAEGPAQHSRGWTVTVFKEAAVGGEVRWRERSVFLRLARAPGKGGSPPPAVGGEEVAQIVAAADVGRRYAAVSGDRNPIHTFPAAARLFGFKGTIAHGMWLKGRALAALGDRLTAPSYTAQVRFRSPLYLPGIATVRAAQEGERLAFFVVGKDGRIHLEGEVRG
jgi:acyl dehydratase